MVVVAIGAFVKIPGAIMSVPGTDKLVHFLYLGLIATLLVRRLRLGLVIAIGVGISVGIELGQYFIPWRSCEVMDAICGIAGTLVAVGLYQVKLYRDIFEYKIF
jgi:glycopeptide antibiotics resistance protein